MEDDEQQSGMHFIYLGVAKALRNRTAHGPIDATKKEALQMLGLVDYLLNLENEAEEREGSGGETKALDEDGPAPSE